MNYQEIIESRNFVRNAIIGATLMVLLSSMAYFVPKTMAYNLWIAQSKIENKDFWAASDNLRFIVYEESNKKKKTDNYHMAMNVFNAIGADYSANSISRHIIYNNMDVPRAYYFAGVYAWDKGNFYEAERYLSTVKYTYSAAYTDLMNAISEKRRLEEEARSRQVASLFIPDSPLDFIPGVKIFKNAKRLAKLNKGVKLSRGQISTFTIRGEQKIKRLKSSADTALKQYNGCLKKKKSEQCSAVLSVDISNQR